MSSSQDVFTIVTLPLPKCNTSGNTDIMEGNLCLPMRVTPEILVNCYKLNGNICIASKENYNR